VGRRRLARPDRVALLAEAHRGRDLARQRPASRRLGARHPIYGAWWRTFVVAAILVVLGSALWPVGQSPVDLELAALLQFVGNLLGVASALLAYLVVDRTSERQHARAAKLAAA
jgi:hypothetical protein